MDMLYLDALFSGLVQVFAWPNFGLMLAGTAIGFVVGLLPGIGGMASMALMLPFIYQIPPVGAMAFLLGMYSVTATTGDMTSILFGVPGEGASAALVVDGHPMAKRGEAGRALGAALMSSLFGAVFGALVLAATVPIVRPLVLALGPPELFMMVILGISFVGVLSGSSVMKGILIGTFGLLLATIGMDPKMGWQRFTFGQPQLWEGLSIAPVAMGLFAIPEIIDMAVKRSSIAEGPSADLGGAMEGVKDTFRHWALVLRCSAIGTIVGIMPGLGAGPAQWVSYAHAAQSSGHKKDFGKGAIEGVLGPGAANNAKEGGALIPTLAFGIPGSPIMAILLGALTIVGLVPGPSMLTKHLDVTFSMVWVIIVSNVITVGICLLFLNQIAKITLVKGTLLIPFILFMVFIGAFAVNNNFSDLIVVVLFGFLGTVMVHLNWPRPPLVLGLVLGPMGENYLWTSVALHHGVSWLANPVVILIAVLTLTVIFYPVWQKARHKDVQGQEVAEAPRGKDFILNPLVILLPAFALYSSRDWPKPAMIFPWVVGIPMLILAVSNLIVLIRKSKTAPSQAALREEPGEDSEVTNYRRTVSIIAWILGFFMAIWFIGMLISVPLFTFLYLKLDSGEKWWVALLLSLISWGILFGIFDWLLHLPFPDGYVFGLLNKVAS